MGQTEMSLPLGSASIREVDILGCFRYRNTVSCLGSVDVLGPLGCMQHCIIDAH